MRAGEHRGALSQPAVIGALDSELDGALAITSPASDPLVVDALERALRGRRDLEAALTQHAGLRAASQVRRAVPPARRRHCANTNINYDSTPGPQGNYKYITEPLESPCCTRHLGVCAAK